MGNTLVAKAYDRGTALLAGKVDTHVRFTNTFHSMGGVDIKATFAGVTFGNLQAVSYSITREKAPIHTMGSSEPRGYARGKRGIAGSLVFVMFDNHVLLESFRELANSIDKTYAFVSDKDELRPGYGTIDGAKLTQQKDKNGNILKKKVVNGAKVINTHELNYNVEDQIVNSKLDSAWSLAKPWYSDQIPPFNITLTGVTELGYASTMAILGVEILNEGYGVSIDDIVSEQQMTYVARAIQPWERIINADFQQARAGAMDYKSQLSGTYAARAATGIAQMPSKYGQFI